MRLWEKETYFEEITTVWKLSIYMYPVHDVSFQFQTSLVTITQTSCSMLKD